MVTDPRQKATGPAAQTMVSGGRAIGAGANQAKGAQQPEAHPDAATAHQRGRRGRHRAPEDEAVDQRLATGRQDPERVAAGRRVAEEKKGGKQRPSQNGQDRAPFDGAGQAPDPNVDYDAWREYTRQHAPAKYFLWNMLHRGSKDFAKHGTRQVLTGAWRAVFDTRPPGEKPPKK